MISVCFHLVQSGYIHVLYWHAALGAHNCVLRVSVKNTEWSSVTGSIQDSSHI